MAQHAVLVTLPFHGTDLGPVFELEDRLIEAIEGAGAGEFDGNEVGGDECVLFMYGPDADALYAAVEPVLRASPMCSSARVSLRYGPADDSEAREVTFTLDPRAQG